MSEPTANLPLGKPTAYRDEYDAGLLCPFPRALKRAELGLADTALPFAGFDLWNAYELSWLNAKGKPVVATAEFRFPCTSPFLIESKSFKLYLNSFNQTRFATPTEVAATLERDLGAACAGAVTLRLFPGVADAPVFGELPGRCLDALDIAVDRYDYAPELLAAAACPAMVVAETLHSHLLKSNCLVTRQPDWASVLIHYQGPAIDHEALLRYLISFRRHSEFHEQCVERIFTDLMRHCAPEKLTVYARYTRRGGLDINPFRSNCEDDLPNWRLMRQ